MSMALISKSLAEASCERTLHGWKFNNTRGQSFLTIGPTAALSGEFLVGLLAVGKGVILVKLSSPYDIVGVSVESLQILQGAVNQCLARYGVRLITLGDSAKLVRTRQSRYVFTINTQPLIIIRTEHKKIPLLEKTKLVYTVSSPVTDCQESLVSLVESINGTGKLRLGVPYSEEMFEVA